MSPLASIPDPIALPKPVPNAVPKERPIALTADACRSVLDRTCFGHLGLTSKGHADSVPIRFAFVEGWLYFRADQSMRLAIAINAWVVVSVVDRLDATHFASVVARGTCYEVEGTGEARSYAAALRGVIRLRDRTPATRAGRGERTSTVFRVHVDELVGRTTFVPGPAGVVSPTQTRHRHRAAVSIESVADDARAADDGMPGARDNQSVTSAALLSSDVVGPEHEALPDSPAQITR